MENFSVENSLPVFCTLQAVEKAFPSPHPLWRKNHCVPMVFRLFHSFHSPYDYDFL